jgi:glycerol kinase
LEAVCFQTNDLVEAMHRDWQSSDSDMVLRVDGGMVASDWTMQRLGDILNAPVDRPQILETTALGAAWLAGRQSGAWPDTEAFAQSWQRDSRFDPKLDAGDRERKIEAWRDAVSRTLSRQ